MESRIDRMTLYVNGKGILMVTKKSFLFVGILSLTGFIDASLLTRDFAKDLIAHDNGKDVVQLSVPNQSSMENGNASCGYQAAFNGLAIRNLLIAPQDARAGNLKTFQEAVARHDKFCKNDSLWRKAIILRRGQKVAKKILEAQIAQSFKGATVLNSSDRKEGKRYRYLPQNILVEFPLAQSEHEALLWEKLWSENCNVAYDLSTQHKEVSQDSLSYTVSADDIKKQFLARIKKRKEDDKTENKAPYEELYNGSKVSEYVDFTDATVHTPLGTDSNWLESDEIEFMLTQQENLDMSTIFIVSDIPADKPLTEAPTLTTSKAYKDFVADYTVNEGSQTGIFLLYINDLTSSAEQVNNNNEPMSAFTDRATKNNTRGHWFCVVAHKVGGERQLIIADSLGNASRIGNIRVMELQCLLQGSDYVKDGRFADWIKKARPNPFLNSVKEFVAKRPYATTFIVGVMTVLLRHVIQNNKIQKADYRSPDNMIEHDIAPIAVH